MHGVSSATATFLFTDIEGSTQLLRSHRAEYAEMLADHHRLLREQFAAYGGQEIGNQGDSFFVAFTRARDAVLAAAECQRALARHPWRAGANVRVRMGIHTGEAERAADRYVGMAIHRAARISAVGHGGQVLVSQTTASLLEDEEDLPGISLKDLGEYRLKDISRPVRLYQLDVAGLPTAFPELAISHPAGPDPRKRAALVATALLVAAAAAIAVFIVRHEEAPAAPPRVLPNSVVRIDPSTRKPIQVVPVGPAPDLVIVAGGFVWVTHYVLRDVGPAGIHNAGDRTLTRVDPSTGDTTVVGGGLAPCGLAADPSGDVWVANCFEPGSGQSATVVRVDASTLAFKATWPVPGGHGFYRGLAYGGGSLWVSDGSERPPKRNTVTQVDPRTGAEKAIPLDRPTGALAWSEGYGDLWINNFDAGSLTRLHAQTGAVAIVDNVATNPSFPAVAGDTVWAGDWSSPQVERLHAVGSPRPRSIPLPVNKAHAGVWNVAAGGGFIWATTPRDGALWRINPSTDAVTRVSMPYLPTGVTANANEVWVTVREK